MRDPKRPRSPYEGWLLAVALLLVVALGAFGYLLWSRDGLSCATELPSGTTLTLPVSSSSTTSTIPAPATTTTEPTPIEPLAFDGAAAMGHIQALAQDIGPRESGTPAEASALDYGATYLQGLGYHVDTDDVALPGGRLSHNVRAIKLGESDSLVIVGAHVDTKATSPGGNDNASGAAVVLELARDLHDADVEATIEFVLFGAEEMTDSDPDHHHYGSRQFVESLTAEESAALAGMISVDMVGYGSEFTVRTMNRGPQMLRDMLKTYSTEQGLTARYVKDTSTYGWSDHEPFELAGYPAVWLEWRDDPAYHTARDTYAHCSASTVKRTGDMLLGFLAGLTVSDLESLTASRIP